MANAVLGIDPGKKGGWALLTDSGAVLNVGIMEDVHHMSLFLKDAFSNRSKIQVFLEKAQAMPKNGSVSMFNYGVGFGQLEGLLIAHRYTYTLVPPRTWCKVMHAGCGDGKPKEKSMLAVKRLFPHADLIAEGCRKEHDGIIDALLIAEYGRRQLYCSKSK